MMCKASVVILHVLFVAIPCQIFHYRSSSNKQCFIEKGILSQVLLLSSSNNSWELLLEVDSVIIYLKVKVCCMY